MCCTKCEILYSIIEKVKIDGRGLGLGIHVISYNHNWHIGMKRRKAMGENCLLPATPTCWLFNKLPHLTIIITQQRRCCHALSVLERLRYSPTDPKAGRAKLGSERACVQGDPWFVYSVNTFIIVLMCSQWVHLKQSNLQDSQMRTWFPNIWMTLTTYYYHCYNNSAGY